MATSQPSLTTTLSASQAEAHRLVEALYSFRNRYFDQEGAQPAAKEADVQKSLATCLARLDPIVGKIF